MSNKIKKDKRVVVVNQDSGYLMIDLVNYYSLQGYDVTLITGKVHHRNTDIKNGVEIVRIIPYKKNNWILRVYTWFAAFLQILFLVQFQYKESIIVLVSNPPLNSFIPLFSKNQFIFLIYDVFPDALVDFGYITRRSLFFKVWKKVQTKAYKKAKTIYTLTGGMKKYIEQYAPSNKIEVAPIWTNNDHLKPIKKEHNVFVKKHSLSNKFIVMYSGNIGIANDLDVIIKAISQINNTDICLLVIGKGPKKNYFHQLCEKHKVPCYQFLSWQPPEVLPYSLASADLAIVNLGSKASQLGIPSKIYNFMSVGVPILSITQKDSDLNKLVKQHDIGMSFEKEDIEGIKNFIMKVYKNPSYKNLLIKNSVSASKFYDRKNVKNLKL